MGHSRFPRRGSQIHRPQQYQEAMTQHVIEGKCLRTPDRTEKNYQLERGAGNRKELPQRVISVMIGDLPGSHLCVLYKTSEDWVVGGDCRDLCHTLHSTNCTYIPACFEEESFWRWSWWFCMNDYVDKKSFDVHAWLNEATCKGGWVRTRGGRTE